MAHFAELDENNIVLRVVVVANEHEADGERSTAHNRTRHGRWMMHMSGRLRSRILTTACTSGTKHN